MTVERLSYTVAEAAHAAGVSADTIYREIRRGHLDATKVGRRTVIPRRALERYIDPSHHTEVIAQAVFS